MNGNSWDFCVFENAFNDSFLELGFVEISSNGNDFYKINSLLLNFKLVIFQIFIFK